MRDKMKFTKIAIFEKKRKEAGEATSSDDSSIAIDREQETKQIFSNTTNIFLALLEKLKRENVYIDDVQEFYNQLKKRQYEEPSDNKK